MPNRLIKESIKRSPEIDRLSWFEEVVFYRMLVTADDYGTLDARPVVLRNDLFPTKDTITRKAVEDAITKLISVGLLIPYVDAESGMSYLYIRNWEKHQVIRNKRRKYPAIPEALKTSLLQVETSRIQVVADRKQVVANGMQNETSCMPESESESKYESEYESFEEEEEQLSRARAREFLTAWKRYIRGDPTEIIVNEAVRRSLAFGFEDGVLDRAVERTAQMNPVSPFDYLMKLLGDWKASKVRTVDDVDMHFADRDVKSGKVRVWG